METQGSRRQQRCKKMFHFHTLNKLHARTDSSKVSFSASVPTALQPSCPPALPSHYCSVVLLFACLPLPSFLYAATRHVLCVLRQPSHSSHLLPALLLLLLRRLLPLLLLLLVQLLLPPNFATNSCPQYASAPHSAHSFPGSVLSPQNPYPMKQP